MSKKLRELFEEENKDSILEITVMNSPISYFEWLETKIIEMSTSCVEFDSGGVPHNVNCYHCGKKQWEHNLKDK